MLSGKITFLGYEVGVKVIAGGRLAGNDLLHEVLDSHGSGKGRYAWDPLTTLLAISGNPASEGFELVTGTNTVNPSDGSNTFTPSTDGRHAYIVLKRTPGWYAGRLDALLQR